MWKEECVLDAGVRFGVGSVSRVVVPGMMTKTQRSTCVFGLGFNSGTL